MIRKIISKLKMVKSHTQSFRAVVKSLLTSTTGFSLGLTADRQTDRQTDSTCESNLTCTAKRINLQIAFDLLVGTVFPLLLGACNMASKRDLQSGQLGLRYTQTGC